MAVTWRSAAAGRSAAGRSFASGSLFTSASTGSVAADVVTVTADSYYALVITYR
jgi:hypothetical protein